MRKQHTHPSERVVETEPHVWDSGLDHIPTPPSSYDFPFRDHEDRFSILKVSNRTLAQPIADRSRSTAGTTHFAHSKLLYGAFTPAGR